MMNVNNEQKHICAECGGACCKSLPGMMFPQDVVALYRRHLRWGARRIPKLRRWLNRMARHMRMDDALEYAFTQQFVVDWWEGNVTDAVVGGASYFIRPRAKNDSRSIRNATWGGECVFLGPNGCVKVFAHRPRVCRELSPRPGGNEKCMPGAGKYEAALAWAPWQVAVETAFRKYEAQLEGRE